VTDNESARKIITNDEVVKALHGADIVLSAILVGDGSNALPSQARYTAPNYSTPDVQRYVAETGGELVTGAPPAAALQPVLKDLTTRYTFQYTAPPAEDGTFRRIRVDLTPEAASRNPGVRIKARSGYTVGAAETTAAPNPK
jgi:hypothetical protein